MEGVTVGYLCFEGHDALNSHVTPLKITNPDVELKVTRVLAVVGV